MKESIHQRRWTGILAKKWPISTRQKPRRRELTSGAFGAKSQGRMVIVVLLGQNLGQTCHQSPWYVYYSGILHSIILNMLSICYLIVYMLVYLDIWNAWKCQGGRVRVFMYPSRIWGIPPLPTFKGFYQSSLHIIKVWPFLCISQCSWFINL